MVDSEDKDKGCKCETDNGRCIALPSCACDIDGCVQCVESLEVDNDRSSGR